MPVGYSLENSLEDKGKRFLYVSPDFQTIAKGLKECGGFQQLKFKLNASWEMIQAHEPECTILYMPHHAPGATPLFENVVLLEELLNANVQLLDKLELLDDAMFCKHIPPKTLFLWCGPSSPVAHVLGNKEKWVAYDDADYPLIEEHAHDETRPSIQIGLLAMEDCMTGMLIMSKKLERTLNAPMNVPVLARRLQPPEPEVVLIIGQLPMGASKTLLLKALETLFAADKVASVIVCDASVTELENITPSGLTFLNISDELDKFSLNMMFREIKRRKPQTHTYMFLGEWGLSNSVVLAHFAKREKELPSSSFVYDLQAWWSLHQKQPDAVSVRLLFNPATAIRHFLSNEASKLQISFGSSKEPNKEAGDDNDEYNGDDGNTKRDGCSCSCDNTDNEDQ